MLGGALFSWFWQADCIQPLFMSLDYHSEILPSSGASHFGIIVRVVLSHVMWNYICVLWGISASQSQWRSSWSAFICFWLSVTQIWPWECWKKKEKRRASEIECVGSLTALTLLQLCAAITRKLTESTLAESESCSSHIWCKTTPQDTELCSHIPSTSAKLIICSRMV